MGTDAGRGLAGYACAFGLAAAAVVGTALGLNLVIDPLWYHRGNRLFDVNYAFNERLSKTNQFLRSPDRFDCLVFGDSRVTLLNEHRIEGHRCFNFSFSAGAPIEFVAFAQYAKSKGVQSRLMLVELNEATFRYAQSLSAVPRFVVEGGNPPSLWTSYASLDAFRFSIATLRGRSPLDRYYRPDFTGDVVPGAKLYRPPALREPDLRPPERPYRRDAFAHFAELRRIYPQSRYVGFVPPVSAWKIAQFAIDGGLDEYLDLQFEAVAQFDLFLDFSAPSQVTEDPRSTYDGSHYYPAVLDAIARAVHSGAPEFGTIVTGMSAEEYKRQYRDRVEDFIGRVGTPRR